MDIHLRILLCVHHSGNGNTEVGDRAPEVCGADSLAICPASMTPIDVQARMDPLNGCPQNPISFSWLFFACFCEGAGYCHWPISGSGSAGKSGWSSVRTGGADIVQHLVRADLGVDCLDCSSHDGVAGENGEWGRGEGEVGVCGCGITRLGRCPSWSRGLSTTIQAYLRCSW